MAGTNKTEKSGITAIDNYFDRLANVDTSYIAINDKKASLDGEINIYDLSKTQQFRKDNLLFSIPVQVKTTSKQIRNNKFRISIADLRYYSDHTNGLVYIVVSLYEETARCFFKKLAPLDLKYILNNLSESQRQSSKGTKTFKFIPFPSKAEAFVNILSDFERQRQLQPKSLLKLSEAPTEEDELTIQIRSNPSYLQDTMMSGIYFYRKQLDKVSGEQFLIPYSAAEIVDVFRVGKTTVKGADGRIIQAEVMLSDTTNKMEVHLGHHASTTIEILPLDQQSRQRVKITRAPHGTYRQRLQDVKDLMEYLDSSSFEPSKNVRKFNSFRSSLQDQATALKEIVQDLEELEIFEQFDPDLLPQSQLKSLDRLLLVKHGRLTPSPSSQWITLDLGKHKYSFLLQKQRILNFFSESIADRYKLTGENDGGIQISLNPYTGIRKNLESYPNFSPELVLKGFEKVNYLGQETEQYYTYYILDLINNYDLTANQMFLSLAESILGLIRPVMSENLWTINKLQIQKRQGRNFSTSTMSLLINISNTADSKERLAAFILLGADQEAQETWDSLTSDDQQTFKDWPIVNISNLIIEN